jgi:hypothetical protein
MSPKGVYEVIEETQENGREDSQLILFKLRFALAMIHENKGEFQKFFESMPEMGKRQKDEDDSCYGERCAVMLTAAVNSELSNGDQLEHAAATAQRQLEWTQTYFGVSSRRHIEAIELLANVRVAQSQHDDAITLLKKSAELRKGLLGNDHPSIASVNKKIDAIRRLELEKTALIWRPQLGSESEPADRYGASKSSRASGLPAYLDGTERYGGYENP